MIKFILVERAKLIKEFIGAKVVQNIYDFKVKTITGSEETLEKYKGKVLLILNVASECGYTKQYSELEEMYKTYKDQGLVVLGFPCNQFGGQEPGSEADIKSFCELNFGVTFPLFAKIDVNGKNASPLFTYLKESQPGLLGLKSIKWNFTKFLINQKGQPVSRYAPGDRPKDIVKEIENLLKE